MIWWVQLYIIHCNTFDIVVARITVVMYLTYSIKNESIIAFMYVIQFGSEVAITTSQYVTMYVPTTITFLTCPHSKP